MMHWLRIGEKTDIIGEENGFPNRNGNGFIVEWRGIRMLGAYTTIYSPGEGEFEEKKSRFLEHVVPVHTEEEALAFVERMKKKYWDARHNCYAYRIGERSECSRASDDGEPSGTAGRPMLEVLAGKDLHDICVVVTRYFGGTLLGTGGLVRAYTAAVLDGLNHAVLIEKKLAGRYRILCPYTAVGKLQYLLAKEELTTLEVNYTDQVEFLVLVPVGKDGLFHSRVQDAFSGSVVPEKQKDLYFAEAEGQILTFDS